jgi:uroporphyrinogen-III decarboxylase
MTFVDSYSFTHRFTDDKVLLDTASYQEIIHQCNGVNGMGLTRQFFQFALGCGYPPSTIVDAMAALSKEYGKAYCGYNEES